MLRRVRSQLITRHFSRRKALVQFEDTHEDSESQQFISVFSVKLKEKQEDKLTEMSRSGEIIFEIH